MKICGCCGLEYDENDLVPIILKNKVKYINRIEIRKGIMIDNFCHSCLKAATYALMVYTAESELASEIWQLHFY